MSNVELTVLGMTCGGCSGRLKRVLEGADGVSAANIVLETKQVTVDFDAANIDENEIKSLIEGAGFSVQAA